MTADASLGNRKIRIDGLEVPGSPFLHKSGMDLVAMCETSVRLNTRSEFSIEAFDKRVLRRFSRLDKMGMDATLSSLRIQGCPGEFWTVAQDRGVQQRKRGEQPNFNLKMVNELPESLTQRSVRSPGG